jgi:hypothetical protein
VILRSQRSKILLGYSPIQFLFLRDFIRLTSIKDVSLHIKKRNKFYITTDDGQFKIKCFTSSAVVPTVDELTEDVEDSLSWYEVLSFFLPKKRFYFTSVASGSGGSNTGFDATISASLVPSHLLSSLSSPSMSSPPFSSLPRLYFLCLRSLLCHILLTSLSLEGLY